VSIGLAIGISRYLILVIGVSAKLYIGASLIETEEGRERKGGGEG